MTKKRNQGFGYHNYNDNLCHFQISKVHYRAKRNWTKVQGKSWYHSQQSAYPNRMRLYQVQMLKLSLRNTLSCKARNSHMRSCHTPKSLQGDKHSMERSITSHDSSYSFRWCWRVVWSHCSNFLNVYNLHSFLLAISVSKYIQSNVQQHSLYCIH